MKIRWLLSGLLASTAASAHVNDRGMDYQRYRDGYGQLCCGALDCRPADDYVEAIANGEPVVRLLIDGTWITVSHSYVVSQSATDGRAHFCGRLHVPGSDPSEVKPEPTCIILPPRDV